MIYIKAPSFRTFIFTLMNSERQLERLGLFDAKVPRYTSYPTAPNFTGSVKSSQYAGFLGAVPKGARLSVYLHVPFCRRLCWFCACRTQGTRNERPVADYVTALKAELAMLASHLPKDVRLSRMHWGGGTPTLLPADMIRDLAGAIANTLPFTEDYEFSVEIDPNDVDEPRIIALRAAGMNRAFVGVQDFDEGIQQSIGRLQSFESTRDTIDLLRAHGVDRLNAEILFGLPHQTPERIADTIQRLISLSPDRVAVLGYAHVPWMARRQSLLPSDALPTPQERLKLFETARDLFVWDGYRPIGIDHFALPGDSLAAAQETGGVRRNFQGYSDDQNDVLVGMGASAISRFPGGYAQNAPSTSDYMTAIGDDQFATACGHVFDDDDALRGRIIEALMCDFAVKSDRLESELSATRPELVQMFETANALFENRLLVSNDGLEIPTDMRPLTRRICQHFDTYSPDNAILSPAN